jgi:hypothetical protein
MPSLTSLAISIRSGLDAFIAPETWFNISDYTDKSCCSPSKLPTIVFGGANKIFWRQLRTSSLRAVEQARSSRGSAQGNLKTQK